MTTPRRLGPSRPLASAVRIAPLAAAVPAAISGTVMAATIQVDSLASFATVSGCSIVDAVESINVQALQAGCTLANANPFGTNDTIDLSGFNTPSTITFANVIGSSALFTARPVTISGSLDVQAFPFVTIERAAVSSDFRLIDAFDALTIDGVSLSGGQATGPGGAILGSANTLGAINIVHSVISGNSASQQGGAIAGYGNIVITNSLVGNNDAGYEGGAIASLGAAATLTVNGSGVFNNTSALRGGGGIYAAGSVVMTGATVSNNTASLAGGGIYAIGGINADSSTISNNVTQGNGGGVAASGAIVLTNSTMLGSNQAQGVGGGAYSILSVTLTRSTASGNTAQSNGGGIFASSVTVTESTIDSNTAQGLELPGLGGGVCAGTLQALNSTIVNNTALDFGGGAFVNTFASVQFTTVAANHTTTFGRGIGIAAAQSSTVLLTAALVYGNTMQVSPFSANDVDTTANTLMVIGGSNDLIGTPGYFVTLPADTLNCDPQLGALANNGGPTQTLAIQSASSCAVDHGPATTAVATTDQRGSGYPRRSGPRTDIGAFEYVNPDRIFYGGFDP